MSAEDQLSSNRAHRHYYRSIPIRGQPALHPDTVKVCHEQAFLLASLGSVFFRSERGTNPHFASSLRERERRIFVPFGWDTSQ